ncbi:hypothetical protein [Haloferax sp. Q22]|uniref:hypothetical protein n=1 Tax=Haloferax sp. (strain Q22) TaxID=1526048 RepID=UPI000737C5AF|nr:hypothetical protein [Haloferax sp. Q22]
MAYFWLNQKGTEGSNYHDEVGEVYHYRGNTPGANQLSEGDKFIYYRPGDYVIFGAGEIDHIEREERDLDSESGVAVDYFAHITNYQSFDPPIRLKGVNESTLKDEISFLKDKPGLTGVPQHSIHQMSQEDFETIIEAGEKEVGPTGARE